MSLAYLGAADGEAGVVGSGARGGAAAVRHRLVAVVQREFDRHGIKPDDGCRGVHGGVGAQPAAVVLHRLLAPHDLGGDSGRREDPVLLDVRRAGPDEVYVPVYTRALVCAQQRSTLISQ